MDGGENDLAISGVPVQREGRNRADGVTHGKIGNIFAHGLDNTGSFVSQAGGEFHRFDIPIIAPHCIGAVDADGFDVDTNFTWSRSGNLRFDEFEDVRSPGFSKLDDPRHGSLRGLYDVDYWHP